MYRSLLVVFLLLIWVPWGPWGSWGLMAGELSPEEMRRLEKRFVQTQQSIRTLRADFEQVIRMPGMRDPVVSRGEFLYRAPNDLRVTFTDPPGDYLLLRGDTFEMARAGKPPARKPSTDRSARALVAIRKVLRGEPESLEDKMDHKISRLDQEFVVSLTPVTRSPQLPEKIENRVDAETLLLRNMTITLPRGMFLEYRFSRPRRNIPLDGTLFQLRS